MKSIVILDFGSQYTQLIARRIREAGVYSEILPYSVPLNKVKEMNPEGLILSGGPSSVLDSDAPLIGNEYLELNVPVLGICYGMQLMTHLSGGTVEKCQNREYGDATMMIRKDDSLLFQNVKKNSRVWMSHGDSVTKMPEGFVITAETEDGTICAVENIAGSRFAIQFHPEVAHSDEGRKIISNFLFDICGMSADWKLSDFLEDTIKDLREKYQDRKVLVGVSGGVDSTTLAVLFDRALGDKAVSVFMNNGLLRENEETEIREALTERLNLKNVLYHDASPVFLDRLRGVADPEQKRKIIGMTFVEEFFEAVPEFDVLAQGTLYPDVIESAPVKGPSRTIKTHHNRVDEIKKLEEQNRIVEPFRFLFKDEVRKIARLLDIPEDILSRHPFPGPGLAVRIIGPVEQRSLRILKKADHIFIRALKDTGWYDKVWQAFAVFLPVRSVGVMGDERAYGNVIALRAVTSVDGMTANRAKLPYEVLDRAANQIVRQIEEVNRVVYDITSKPPSTIEWE